MMTKMTRREFIATATATGAAVYSADSLAALAVQNKQKLLSSTLMPVRSGSLVNAARNRVVYQSGSADDDHMGHLVTDGSNVTWWESPPGESWISIDLGRTVKIARLTIRWGRSGAQNYRIEMTPVEHPAQWATVFTGISGAGDTEEIPLQLVQARHIRLTGSAKQPESGFSITQLEAWSPDASPAPVLLPQVCSRGGNSLTRGWSLQCDLFSRSDPADISSPEYTGSDWIPAQASATVLASYLAAGAIPNPYYGNQVAQISDGFFSRNDFWYRNTFDIAPDCHSRRLWLVLDGINWKADIYFNGVRLGNVDGAFIRGRFDITQHANYGSLNCVAVLIHQVAHPGPVRHKVLGQHYRNGGILGLDSPTFLSSIGWNWVPTIPGREIGIWDDVRFETTGDVLLVDPWVTCELPNADLSRADLTAKVELKNVSGEARQCALVLSMEDLRCRQEFDLQPNETRVVALDKSACAALTIHNPRLWWPNGYGDPVLHSMKFSVESAGKISDEKTVSFGIRTLGYKTDDGILRILVNNHPILCRGGNWGMDDALLICDRQGYDLRVRMHRDSNLNMIRNWIGMVGRDGFYESCDRHGVLIWDDFWLANPGDGPDPTDHAMFMNNAVDRIRRRRHHASLALYCGRNEGMPPPDLDSGLRNATAQLDGTRFYIPASDRGLVTGHGPYNNEDPAWYFAHRGATFHSEQGIVCVPVAESMRAMMPAGDLWPISDMWAIHDYQEPRSVLYTERIGSRYGKPAGIDDYCRKAQMVNLESAKAMYECLRSRRGGGQLVWMTQAAWPALICQLYDYYFDQTAAYFGAKTACAPIHILWNQATNTVQAANDTRRDLSGLRAEAWIVDLDGHVQRHQSAPISVSAGTAQDCFVLEGLDRLDRVCFVRLQLSLGKQVLSENFYWSPAQDGDCTALNTLPQIRLPVSAHWTAHGPTHSARITVSNPTQSVALAVRIRLVRTRSGQRVLPAMYEDNYFSLLPRQSRTVKIQFPDQALAGERAGLVLSGWNIREIMHSL
jgi:hypothetical protein